MPLTWKQTQAVAFVVAVCASCSSPAAPPQVAEPKAAYVQAPPAPLNREGHSRPPSRCGQPSPPPAALVAPLVDASCRVKESKLHKELSKQLRRRFELDPEFKLVIDFTCDGLPNAIDAFTFSRGAGHGHNLELYGFTRSAADFDVRRMSYQLRSRGEQVEVASARLPSAKLDAALRKARVALGARMKTVRIIEEQGTGSAGLSSYDFHLAIRLRHQDKEKSWRFTGYESSLAQEDFLALQLAAKQLAPLLEAIEFVPRAITTEDRKVFAAHFNKEAAYFHRDFNWWVKERLVAMSRSLGSRALLHSLLSAAENGSGRSEADTRRDVLTAVATITGWDATAMHADDATGETALADYKRECGPP